MVVMRVAESDGILSREGLMVGSTTRTLAGTVGAYGPRTAKVGLAGRHRRPGQCERRQRAALCFEEGVEATTAVILRITPSDLLKT